MLAKNSVLLQSDLFAGLDQATVEQFTATAEFRTFAADEKIVAEGQQALFVYCVMNGFVRLSKSESAGREADICVCEPGDTFGEYLLAGGRLQRLQRAVRRRGRGRAVCACGVAGVRRPTSGRTQERHAHHGQAPAGRDGLYCRRPLAHSRATGGKLPYEPLPRLGGHLAGYVPPSLPKANPGRKTGTGAGSPFPRVCGARPVGGRSQRQGRPRR